MSKMANEKRAEEIAVVSAVLSGRCEICSSYYECMSNEHFEFPSDAYCMRQKDIILKGWVEDGK